MKIKFQACDVRPSAQKDGGVNIVFECGEDAAPAAALLFQIRKQMIEIEVGLVE